MTQDLSVLEPFLGGLVGSLRVKLKQGATPEQLTGAQQAVGFVIPPDLRRFYRACNGLTVSVIMPLEMDESEGKTRRSNKLNYEPAFRILSLDEAIALYHDPAGTVGFPDLQHTFGLFPFTDAFDSDPYYYGCKSTLQGKIIHVRHDDYCYPASRSLKGFLRLVWNTLSRYHDLEFLQDAHDYSDWNPLRTTEDDLTAKDLLRLVTGEDLSDEIRHLCRQWAAAMLGPESLKEFGEILDGGDETGRDIAFGRLCHITTQAADKLVHDYRDKQRRFLKRLRGTFEKAGFDASVKGCSLHVKGVGWVNVQVLFTERRNPKILKEFLTRNRGKEGFRR